MTRSRNSQKKPSTVSLTATKEVIGLISKIRRKYITAELQLNPNDDQPFSGAPGKGQILRAGLIMLDATLESKEPGEVVRIIDEAARKTGPDSDESHGELDQLPKYKILATQRHS